MVGTVHGVKGYGAGGVQQPLSGAHVEDAVLDFRLDEIARDHLVVQFPDEVDAGSVL